MTTGPLTFLALYMHFNTKWRCETSFNGPILKYNREKTVISDLKEP